MITVTRAPKAEGQTFARILNATLQDARLSFRARGVLAYVLSMPPQWRHSAENLADASPDGKIAVLSALRELHALGYSDLCKVRADNGTLRNCRIFTESPADQKRESVDADPPKPADGEPPPLKGEKVNRPTLNRPSVDRPVGKGGGFETTVEKRLYSAVRDEGSDFLSTIYDAYPRKVKPKTAKKAIIKALTELRRCGDHPGHDTPESYLLDRVNAYAAAVKDWPTERRQYIPHPSTWFNAGQYADDPAEWIHRTPTNAASKRQQDIFV